MKKGILLLVVLGLTGCFEKREVIKTERVTMEVVSVQPKSKHKSRVSLKVVGVNQVYTDLRLGCRRGEAAKVKIGSKWDVYVEDFKQGDKYGSTVLGVKAICTLSQ